jgi:phage nucleotide-binding protein
MLVYGEPGVGKTRLAGSADEVPELRKVLFVDVEGGTYTLRASSPHVDVIRVKTWRQVQDIYDALFAGGHGYSTVVIDSLTETQKFNMSEVMAKLLMEDPGRDPDIAGMREWGKNIEQIRRFVRAFRDLEMNVIFTALAKSDKNARTGVITKKPYMSGKLADEVAGFLDIVMYMYMKELDGEQKRLLLTGATDEYVAKDRSAKLPLVIENPNMKTLFHLITSDAQALEPKEKTT